MLYHVHHADPELTQLLADRRAELAGVAGAKAYGCAN